MLFFPKPSQYLGAVGAEQSSPDSYGLPVSAVTPSPKPPSTWWLALLSSRFNFFSVNASQEAKSHLMSVNQRDAVEHWNSLSSSTGFNFPSGHFARPSPSIPGKPRGGGLVTAPVDVPPLGPSVPLAVWRDSEHPADTFATLKLDTAGQNKAPSYLRLLMCDVVLTV